jgi:hypothetical protein
MAAITCASCQRPLRVPENVLGQLVQCPLCLYEFVAQADPVAESAARVAEALRKRAAARLHPVTPLVQDDSVTEVEEFEEAPVWVEPVVETPSQRKSTRKTPPVKRVVFQVLVARDPDILCRRMEAELTADGLYLRKPRKAVAFAAVGCKARYLGANRLVVTVEGREVELTVVKPWTSVYHLARDTASFLGNNGDFPEGSDYELPWHLYALPPLFALLPFAACSFGLLTEGCEGVVLWCLIAAVMAGVSYAVAVQPRLMPRTRLIGAGSLAGLGALIFLLAFYLTPSYSVDASLWRVYMPPDGSFRVKIPGSPAITEKPITPFNNGPDDDVVVFYTVDLEEPQVRFAVSNSPAPSGNAGWNMLPGNNVNNFQAINEAKSRLRQEYDDGHFVLKTERDLAFYGQTCHEMVYRYSPVGDDIGTMTQTLVARVYVVNDRTYTLTVLGLHVKSDGPDALKFFDSFQINPLAPREGK